jgi:hypothetical protein
VSFLTILKIIAAVATVGTGALGLIKPTAIYGFTGLKAEGVRGISEIRAIFCGLFIFGDVGYQVLGLGYLLIAVTRLISIVIDRSTDRSNLISLGIEIVLGIILILR